MKKILIITNWQKEVPPFIITQIKYAKNMFDEVVYITRNLKNDNSKFISFVNVKVIQINVFFKYLFLFKLPLMFFKKEVYKNFLKAFKTKKFNLTFLINTIQELLVSDVLFTSLKKQIKKYNNNFKIFLLASWFDANAYAVAKIKKINNKIVCTSFAHAFEVNPERSNLIDLAFNEFKHKYLDKITFISNKVLTNYLNFLSNTCEVSKKNIEVCHLGIINDDYEQQYLNLVNSNDIIELVSCSNMVELKRLNIILNLLENWDERPIHWTHIGGGPLFDEISSYANTIIKHKSNVKITLLGSQSNLFVKEYYKKNVIDLFINVSSSEGLPVSLMEAISYGIPVIATDVGGTSEIVNDKTGFLLSKNPTIDEIEKNIISYINLSIDEKILLKHNVRSFWERTFNAENNVTEFYKKLISMGEKELS